VGRYTYTGEPGRYYPRLGLRPEPGAAYELAANPDPARFDPPDPAPEPPEPEPETRQTRTRKDGT
jgi:hypothetical protein